MKPLRSSLPLTLFAGLFWATPSHAAIPAFYTGTPYMGTPQTIPGRVELANMDLGGIHVAWYADHNRMNSAGYEPISGNDYRPDDQDLPNICKTNRKLELMLAGLPAETNSSEDFWEDGTRYPSEAHPYVYYMGYAHTVDWVRVTVDVKQAGTYNVSSDWACANVDCGCSIWFNDGSDPNAPDDGVNKSGVVPLNGTNDYHKWRAYPNFAQVTLSQGLQVMTFHVERGDHLQYGFLQFDPVGGYPDAGAGDAGTGTDAGTSPGTGGSAGTAAGGSAGEAGAPMTNGGSGGSAGATTSTGGSSGGSGGSSASGGDTTTAGSGGDSSSSSNDSSGCGCATVRTDRSSSLGFGLAALGAVLSLRRRARRK